jgi:hypothetical protein
MILPFIFVMGNSNLIRCWRLYVITHSSESETFHVEINDSFFPDVPENLQRDVLFDVDFNSKEMEVNPVHLAIKDDNEDWGRKMYRTARKRGLCMAFFVVTTLDMIVPSIVFSVDRNDRETILSWTSYCITSAYLLSCVAFLIKLSHVRNKFSLWNHLARTCVVWTVTCAALYTSLRLKEEIPKDLLKYLLISFPTLPFFFERIWPLLMNYNNNKTEGVGIEYIVSRNIGSGKKNEGWKALASYIDEINPSFDSKENKMLSYGLLFLREYLTKMHDKNADHSRVIDEGEDGAICGLVILTWMKFLYQKGDFKWDVNSEVESCFTISSPRIRSIKRDMEKSLIDMVAEVERTKRKKMQKKAARELRNLYHVVLDETEKKILKGFRKSHQFRVIMDIIQRERVSNPSNER